MVYYKPVGEGEQKSAVMRTIDHLYLERPTRGSRATHDALADPWPARGSGASQAFDSPDGSCGSLPEETDLSAGPEPQYYRIASVTTSVS